ncbi:DNA phosphorothioation-associated putative methyltransferase [Coleofasciculus sp. FACHB-SPT36]|uniref:DNA phosphorothioation-associated putative methyltransferase n=1 Tax=Cyanophyceae TaxID=3028117 RepID=UPI00168AB75D|nr:DNA phosphorothioation-associated putative methyltransferase [Coleofasciculus sp. FACHB-SPT36]MBD2539509.1 DNA phosphorothioation-associated putative methyltransferase [Coleofasciculus sp. FACHB-SPT36]
MMLNPYRVEEWDAKLFLNRCAKTHHRQDILLYLAVSNDCSHLENLAAEVHNNLPGWFDSDKPILLGANDLSVIVNCCQQSPIGKLLPGALYVHVSALSQLDPLLRLYEGYARRTVGRIDGATLIKFNIEQPKISYLFYPDFDTDPHPALQASIQIDVRDGSSTYRDYSTSDNPPVLHRKETFVTPDYPHYEKFANLTRQEEKLRLLDKTRGIGTLRGWLECLQDYGVEIQGHQVIRRQVVENLHPTSLHSTLPKIERHKAAIARKNLSRPVRLALEAGLFSEDSTFFDYGCGYGSDIQHIAEKGYASAGWDPYYSPDTPRTNADIVNLGYIINVIERTDERREALLNAWELTGKVLIIAALVLIDDRGTGQVAYGDGVITRRNTFQKYYEQEELKIYIDQVLNVNAVPVALGIYFVFRDESLAEAYRASRFRSRATTPRVRANIKRFEDYQEMLAPLMAFVTERGRLPVKNEKPELENLRAEFGGFRRAFQVILQATDQKEWDALAQKRRLDLLVYLALGKLNHLKLKQISPEVRNDIKSLFGSYEDAWELAEEMLFSLGDPGVIAQCCIQSFVGCNSGFKYAPLYPSSFIVHVSAFSELDPLLRLYEGCASRTIGRMDEATLIKFHTYQPKISYLFYPNFDADPHPVLHTSMQIDLRDLSVSYRDYEDDVNPPILHRKETVITPDYPNYEKFSRLTQQEEDWGLLDDEQTIKTLRDWQRCLKENCLEIEDYCLCWRKDSDPIRVQELTAVREKRKNTKVTSF